MMNKEKLVVIGNGMVGHHFLEGLVGSQAKDHFEITTFCEEPRLAYDRVHLSEYFSGKTAADLSMVKPGFFERNDIRVHIGQRAESIDRTERIVRSSAGFEVPYDKIVLATGSYPFVPPVAGP